MSQRRSLLASDTCAVGKPTARDLIKASYSLIVYGCHDESAA
ncbi:MAG: hypothetical protein QW587_02720 [Candidatus Bathyarchaeia archaeon]